ncbi:PREDICTED: PBAN-type neuropeptides-like isoform X2 [Vollenhovia emeryi]|uniref:PBAN-type neuropeptides-like isoform X2 n=1 Tax=Vollenhovia emeryi TaxID=411798 RepID=UPI0005F4BE50|nr:PREDICTED: PBAN-type neuropeptides-like isoform X2 [Vollenhovia emeryi]
MRMEKTTSTPSQRRYSTTPIKPRGSAACPTLFRCGVSRNDVSAMIVTGNPVSRATTVCILALLLCLSSRVSESRETSPNGGSSDGRTPSNNFGSCIEGKCIKRTTQDITSGMWFGPRLGKRRRSEEKQEVSPEIEVLANTLDGARWAVITIPASDKRQPQFTPRLGRGSSEDLFSYGDAYEVDEDDRSLPPIFAPRLGRRLPWIPSPRLGRQLRNALRKL